MADVRRVLDAFIEEDRGPAPADPARFLARVKDVEREELAVLIDAYLARAPRRSVDPAMLRATESDALAAARELAERIERSYGGLSGEWPVVLPRLRHQARLTRRALVAAVAERLGVGSEIDGAAAYYHRMEQGLLPAGGVSDRVVEALGALLGESPERLRAAGMATGWRQSRPGADSPVAFARVTTPDDEPVVPDAEPPERAARRPRSYVDELFTGGRDAGRHP